MNNRLKNILLIAADIALCVYLVLAVTSFNTPSDLSSVCTRMNVRFEEPVSDGFLTQADVITMLKRQNLFPEGQPMTDIDVRQIEECLQKNPFVNTAECYKTHDGRVVAKIAQRKPVVHVMSADGANYYVDEYGDIMPNVNYPNHLVVATGNISTQYAKKELAAIGCFLSQNRLWNNQIEQLNILGDGSVELVPRVGDHIIYLGQPTDLQGKMDRLRQFYRYGLSKAGWNKYSYINLEYSNQIICKRRKI